MEREKDEDLKKEVRERRENGEDCLIKSGEIVRRRRLTTVEYYVINHRKISRNRALRGREQEAAMQSTRGD